MEIKTKYGCIKIFAKTLEEEALGQIIEMGNSPLGENSIIRIMPDAHAGKGCTIGTTMTIKDKICPNLVGVDIGCGVTLIKTDIDFSKNFNELDNIIRKFIPYGASVHSTPKKYDFTKLKCWEHLSQRTKDLSGKSLGTLGGGNHFIEAYADGYLSVHSGSRNIGYKVAEYYQNLAEKTCFENLANKRKVELLEIEKSKRAEWLKENQINIEKNLAYLEDENMRNYLFDIKILQKFADENRSTILQKIVKEMNGKIIEKINSIHNYIDISNMILRKGAISATKDEQLVIPLNMKDGLLVCKGKGNEDWNYSAPHGAGRLYSRSKAKETFSLEKYQKEMEGIFSTCISENTIDEAPFVYKDYKEIMECIEPSVEIMKRLLPIYNFKAN